MYFFVSPSFVFEVFHEKMYLPTYLIFIVFKKSVTEFYHIYIFIMIDVMLNRSNLKIMETKIFPEIKEILGKMQLKYQKHTVAYFKN